MVFVRSGVDPVGLLVGEEDGAADRRGGLQHERDLDRHLGDLERLVAAGAEREDPVVAQEEHARGGAVPGSEVAQHAAHVPGQRQPRIDVGDDEDVPAQHDDLVREQRAGPEELGRRGAEQPVHRDRMGVRDDPGRVSVRQTACSSASTDGRAAERPGGPWPR